MTTSTIHDAFRDLASDKRFADVGLALYRGVVNDTLDYEIHVDTFELGDETMTALRQFAGQNELDITVAEGGSAILRRSPNSG